MSNEGHVRITQLCQSGATRLKSFKIELINERGEVLPVEGGSVLIFSDVEDLAAKWSMFLHWPITRYEEVLTTTTTLKEVSSWPQK